MGAPSASWGGESDVLDPPQRPNVIEARDATLNRPVRLTERSGIIAEALAKLPNAKRFVDVPAHEQPAHAVRQLANSLAANGLARHDDIEPTVRRWRMREEDVWRRPGSKIHSVVAPLVGESTAGVRAPADTRDAPPEPHGLTTVDRPIAAGECGI